MHSKILKFTRYIPLVILLNIFPLIRGCGDNGHSESIGFPLPLASIENSIYSGWHFPIRNIVISKNSKARMAINTAFLFLVFLIIYLRYYQASNILISTSYQLFVLLFLFGYRLLTPYTFMPSLIIAIPVAIVFPSFPDEILWDAASRFVFVCILFAIYLLVLGFKNERKQNQTVHKKL